MHFVLIIPLYHNAKSLDSIYQPFEKIFSKIILFDNTPNKKTPHEIQEYSISSNVLYIRRNKNIGLASAFNYCVQNYGHSDSDIYMLLDQDTKVKSSSLVESYLLSNLDLVKHNNIVGIIGTKPWQKTLASDDQFGRKVSWVINSGMLFSKKVWQSIGGFDESFFVDDVDHEFCLRASSFGISTILVNNNAFIHEIGRPKYHAFFNKKIKISRHPLWRRYYWARNRTILFLRHRNLPALYLFLTIFRELLVYLVFEQRKFGSIAATARGLVAAITAKKRKEY